MKPTTRRRLDCDPNNELWRQALEELRLQMTRATYQTWLAHSYVVDSASSPASLTVAVSNNYAKEWLAGYLQNVVNRTVSAIAGRPITVTFVAIHHFEEDLTMLTVESQENEGLDHQSGDESLPHHICQTRRIDRLLARAGIIPTYALELPQNITFDDILLRGGRDPMTTQHNLTRIRIYSHVTQSTFLHVEDALAFGKLRLFAGTYQRGKGITANAHHFLDMADARIVLQALAQAEPGFSYQEYKGSANDGADVTSRVFSVEAKDDRVYVELKNGPGRLTDTGVIQPNGKPAAEITIPFKTYEARRLALETLAYLRAWDVVRLATHRELISGFPSYLLSSPSPDNFPADPTNDSSGSLISDTKSKAPPGKFEKELIAETAPAADDKALAMEQVGQMKEESFHPDVHADLSSPLLHYQDGMLVAPSNEDERRAFLQYRKSHGEDPSSLSALRSWYAQHNLS